MTFSKEHEMCEHDFKSQVIDSTAAGMYYNDMANFHDGFDEAYDISDDFINHFDNITWWADLPDNLKEEYLKEAKALFEEAKK
jgi:hypothetical protein